MTHIDDKMRKVCLRFFWHILHRNTLICTCEIVVVKVLKGDEIDLNLKGRKFSWKDLQYLEIYIDLAWNKAQWKKTYAWAIPISWNQALLLLVRFALDPLFARTRSVFCLVRDLYISKKCGELSVLGKLI